MILKGAKSYDIIHERFSVSKKDHICVIHSSTSLLYSPVCMYLYPQVGATLVEAAQFEVPGFATGCYMVAAMGGKILWEQANPDN